MYGIILQSTRKLRPSKNLSTLFTFLGKLSDEVVTELFIIKLF